ncbi:hypothetical protein CO230_05375 [Chryseobacterium sp. 6424]|nr:hypothetical protein CO230_05375 [Chryseobacterium sp. 6424]
MSLIGLFFISGCTTQRRVSQIQVIESNSTSITLDVNSGNPEYAAIYQLLFRGFPESNQTYPLISTAEDEIQKQYPAYFKDFFQKQQYKTFVTVASKNEDGSYRIVLNTKALKSDLEQNSIIRKFGY